MEGLLAPPVVSPPKPPPIPTFAELPRGSVFRRIGSNLVEFVSASPKSASSWQFAWMFRSAYLRGSFPTRPLLESVLLHVVVLTFWISDPLPRSSPVREVSPVEVPRVERRIIWYTKNDRLPAISPPEPKPPVRRKVPRPPARVRLEFHPVQRMISKPPQPDNSRQTIVQPEAPRVQLPKEVHIPNIVAWSPTMVPPPPSVAEGRKQLAQVRVPKLPVPVVSAPTPVPPKLNLPEVSAPEVTVSELPKLPVPPPPVVAETQQQLAQIRVPRMPAPAVSLSIPVPPPPEVSPRADSAALPTLVAVGVAPAPPPEREEVNVPLGNRAGEFAVSPEGTENSGRTLGTESDAARSRTRRTAEEPRPPQLEGQQLADIRVPNLLVDGDKPPAMAAPTVANPPEPRPVPPSSTVPSTSQPAGDLKALLARATRPSLLPEMTRGKMPEPGFFGNRRVYTVSINMPNLSSGSGSWILRFAELGNNGTEAREEAEISSPVAVKKVDPQYVPAAIRERVEGSVTLAARILRDGTVSNIAVVQSLDPRLDLSAVQALTLWQFQPARKKGAPVDLEVLVQIPFRLPAF
ncbi:MAG: hypothetical protein A3J28_15655 [Acidobacteria bacterium RIFCSPLOWO2_12_FULL_60_22]|nr:MAG: hypothetical protein A3J28_15655 [Acidobacteria bacterium RIFCSPLOWO2_12_FULL_60_22]